MKSIKSITTHWVVASIVFSAAAMGYARDIDTSAVIIEIERAKSELQKLKAKKTSTDSLIRFEADVFAKRVLGLESQRKKREEELQSSKNRLQNLRKELNAQLSREARALNRAEANKARLEAMNQKLAGEITILEERVKQSIPISRQDRLDRVSALKRDAVAGTSSPEETLSRLSAIYKEEIRFGDEAKIKRTAINRQNGLLVNVDLLRMGNVWAAYMDPEGKYFGILHKDNQSETGWTWQEDLSFKEREYVRNAIEVRAARQAPSLVLVPFSQKGWTTSSPTEEGKQ